MFSIYCLLFFPAFSAFPLLWQDCKMLEMSHQLSNETIVYPIKSYMENRFKLNTVIKGMTGPTVKGGEKFFLHYNTFQAVEHISTHMDAPKHVLRNMKAARQAKTVHEIPLTSLVGEACVIDVPDHHKHNKDYLITIEDIHNWEGNNGKLHKNCIVLVRSGQGKHWGNTNKYLGSKNPGHLDPFSGWPDNMHWPGMDWTAAEWIIENRGLKAFGQDAMSVDYGKMLDFSNSVHSVVLGANKPAFENLRNLDKLPKRGVTIIALPMFIKYGSGAPARIIAIGWDGQDDPCRVDLSNGYRSRRNDLTFVALLLIAMHNLFS